MPNNNTIDTVRAVEQSVTYPVLTKDISGAPPSGGGPSAPPPLPGGGQSLDALAQNSIRQALGWRYRADDPKGFLSALRKAFKPKDVKGHTEWDYQPQSYTVQADMGEITGAQASIFARAKNALEQTLPLLNGLTPLKPDPDLEDIEAMRSIIRDELGQLVGEFGQVAGPRVQRVDNLFKLLLGPAPDYRDPIRAKGHLGQLGSRLGMERRLVNSIEDEQDLTNFLILVDYTNSLYTTWVAQRDFFSRGKHGEPFLGTQLVLLSQALASVGERVQDAYDALDSVFVGAAERQSLFLNYFGEFAPITLAELLSWIMDFSTNDGPQLMQESGKDGVVAFRSTMTRMRYLMFLTVELSRSDRRDLGDGFATYRSQAALEAVRNSMALVDREADKIHRAAIDDDPTLRQEGDVFWIEDATITSGGLSGCTITVGGENLKPGARMLLISREHPEKGLEGKAPPTGPSMDGGVTPDGHFITANFSYTSTSLAKSYTLVVINTTGAYAWLTDAISANKMTTTTAKVPTPKITFATLRRDRSGKFVLIIHGSNFADNATVKSTNVGIQPLTPDSVTAEEIRIKLTKAQVTNAQSNGGIAGIAVTNPNPGGIAQKSNPPVSANLP